MGRKFEVWFYIGAMLLLYGAILVSAGTYQWVHPPATVLANKHATFWIGLMLLLIGLSYAVPYWPKPDAAKPADGSLVE